MEQHILRYTKYIYEDLHDIDIDTATYKDHLHKSFEWFACIQLSVQHNSIFLLWEDVPPQLREEKGMSRDMGIDAWDIEGNRVSQMKLYQGCISWRHFATFLGCCFKFKDAAKILYRTHESQLCSMIQSYIVDKTIIDTTVSEIDFREECKRIQTLTFPSSILQEKLVIRPYQMESITYLKKGKDANKNVYLCIPTGCGKTLIILQYHIIDRSEILLVLVPRVVLMEQWGEECMKLGIKPYLIGTGQHRNMEEYKDESIVICVYDSFPNIYKHEDRFGRYCIDEAHHIKTPERYIDTDTEHETYNDSKDEDEEDEEEEKPISYMKCVQSLSDTKRVIYLSATLDPPTDDSLFFEYKVRKAIDEEYLCDYQFVFPIFEQEYINNEHLAYYLVHKQHESHCVIYAPSCKEGLEFTDMLNQLQKGCAGYIDADTSYKERQRLFTEFESGQLHFLVNIRILVEGFNAPHIRSIFFLHVSTSEIFIIQAIGRALRQHRDKQLATIYIPFTQESDLERIQTFLHQLSTYDERIKKTISEKKMGGYLSLERGEDVEVVEDDEKQEDADLFTFRYNLIVDRMGNSNQMEEIQIRIALEYKRFYRENDKKPVQILKSKSKEKATDNEKKEHKLAHWFSKLKHVKRISRYTIYLSVEAVMIELFGEKWYEKENKEHIALRKAIHFKEFYQTYERKPSLKLQGKSKEKKEKATKNEKQEHDLATWFLVIKRSFLQKKGVYPSVLIILEELLGKSWYEKEDNEYFALEKANSFKEFYTIYKRFPKSVLQGKSDEQKEKATESEKHEHNLAIWFGSIKGAKREIKTGSVLYKSVEAVMIELFGEKWYEKEDKEHIALEKANSFKEFYTTYKRLPKSVLQGKSDEQKENSTENEKHEHNLALWFGDTKKSKKSDRGRNRIVYPCVEDIFNKLLGESWYENSLESNALLTAIHFKEFYQTYERKPSLKLQGKSKEKKEKATENEKQEHDLAKWFCRMKGSKNGKSTSVLYPSIEKLLIELLGGQWFI